MFNRKKIACCCYDLVCLCGFPLRLQIFWKYVRCVPAPTQLILSTESSQHILQELGHHCFKWSNSKHKVYRGTNMNNIYGESLLLLILLIPKKTQYHLIIGHFNNYINRRKNYKTILKQFKNSLYYHTKARRKFLLSLLVSLL